MTNRNRGGALTGSNGLGLMTWRVDEEIQDGYQEYTLKRPLDVFLALIGLLMALPMSILAAIAIWVEDRGQIFYSQERVGRGGKLYRMWKFRTMVPDAERLTGPVRATRDDPRVTRVGKFLRRTALDEIPQLWSILTGEMSFVGPRSYRSHFVGQFRREVVGYDLRHVATPGLTGMAQLYGSKSLSPQQMLRLDLLYIKHCSLRLDLKLIIASFWVTLKGEWEKHSKKI